MLYFIVMESFIIGLYFVKCFCFIGVYNILVWEDSGKVIVLFFFEEVE